MKLALGTAQFGLDYGISNKIGKTSIFEVKNILQTAQNANINTIDTAPAYGNSEQVLGSTMNTNWNVITKTSQFISVNSVIANVKKSLQNLELKSIYGLLIHNVDDIYQSNFSKLYQKLLELKQDGLVKKLGFSTYTPEQINNLLDNYNFDIIQLPINIFDQRLIQGGQLKKLKERGVEIHARSIFLQGLLLEKVPQVNHFNPWQEHFNDYFSYLKNNKISKLSSALNFALNLTELDKIIIGVNNATQLQEIITHSQKNSNINYNNFAIEDENLINPALWII